VRKRGKILATLGLFTGTNRGLDARGGGLVALGEIRPGVNDSGGAQEGNRPESVTSTVTSFPD